MTQVEGDSNQPDERVVLSGATLIDGTGAPPAVTDVVIADGSIVDIGIGCDGDTLIDLTGQWLMPGLIDCHIHAMVRSFDLMDIIDTPFSLNFYRAAQSLRSTLEAGITSARDTGGADLGVKRALELGLISGPRLQICVNLLSITGGHADQWSVCGYSVPDFPEHPGRPDGVCDGPTEVVRKTRQMIRAGADIIKVCASGGLLSPTDEPHTPQFLPLELDLIAAEAKQSGTRVVAHAQGAEGVKNAIRAGASSIEHGFYLDDESIDLMLTHDVHLVPTLMAPLGVIETAAGRRESEVAQAREAVEAHRDSVRRAFEAGVRIAMGTDSGATAHGRNREELVHMASLGMTPMEVLMAATRNGARNLGEERHRGTVEIGKVADLVCSRVDPLSDLEQFAMSPSISHVWKGGRLEVWPDERGASSGRTSAGN